VAVDGRESSEVGGAPVRANERALQGRVETESERKRKGGRRKVGVSIRERERELMPGSSSREAGGC
jgi:hypothetical protein